MHFQGILRAPMAKAIPSTQNVAAQRCDFPPILWGWGVIAHSISPVIRCRTLWPPHL